MTRKFLLGSSASLFLAASLLAAAPAFAQYDNSQGYDDQYSSRDSQDNYARRSTPAERAQTQDLNRNGVRTGPPSPSDQSAYDQAQQNYNDARRRYDERMRAYNKRSRAYQDRLRDYNDDRDDYQDNADRYDDDRYGPGAYDVAPPPAPIAGPATGPDVRITESYTGPELWTLDRIANPNRELFNTQVRDIDGYSVGRFRRLETRDDGEMMAVITLDTMRTVAVPMEQVRFDPDRSIVVAQLTANELARIPSDTPIERAF